MKGKCARKQKRFIENRFLFKGKKLDYSSHVWKYLKMEWKSWYRYEKIMILTWFSSQTKYKDMKNSCSGSLNEIQHLERLY